MARTPKTVEDRGEQIMDAALRVFARKGFDRATNRDIAEEAGITAGLIYHYFESKEALLRAVIAQRSPAGLVRSLSPELLAQAPETMLRAMLLQMLSVVEGEEFVQLLRLFLPEVIYNPQLAPLGLATYGEAVRFFEDYLAAKIAHGELENGDPALAAQVLMSSIMGFVLRRQVLRDPTVLQYTREQIVDGVLATALHGLLPH